MLCILRQADEREQIEAQAQLLAFDRQNHSGASDALAANLKAWHVCAAPSCSVLQSRQADMSNRAAVAHIVRLRR